MRSPQAPRAHGRTLPVALGFPHRGNTANNARHSLHVGSAPLVAPVAGVLRGLTHDGVPVGARTKVIEVDPRCRTAEVRGIAERPRRNAEGVLSAIQPRQNRQP